ACPTGQDVLHGGDIVTGQEAVRRRPRPAPDGGDLANGLARVRVVREPGERLLLREFGADGGGDDGSDRFGRIHAWPSGSSVAKVAAEMPIAACAVLDSP